MPCTDTLSFFAYADRQRRGVNLGVDDDNNAGASLIYIDPFIDENTRALYRDRWNRSRAYFFLGVDGCPILVVPDTSPSYDNYVLWLKGQSIYSSSSQTPPPDSSSSTPPPGSSGGYSSPITSSSSYGGFGSSSSSSCPPGWVAQPPGFLSSSTLEEMINHQLIQIPMREDLATGACKPLPTVTTAGIWVTPEDCLQVSILTTQRTSGLILVARILDCAGVLHYMSYGLDNVPVAVRTTLTLPVTPGYLLDVCVSALGSGVPAGSVFASVGIQHTCAAGVPPSSILAAGYVSDLYAVSWPASPTGAPYTPSVPLPGPAVPAILQFRAGLVATDSAGVSVTLAQTVSAGGSALVAAFSRSQADTVLSDSQANTGWTRIYLSAHHDLWICPNAKPGATTVTAKYSAVDGVPLMLHVIELARIATNSPVDAFAHAVDGTGITATTASTSVPDVGAAAVFGMEPVTAGVTPPAGWTQVLDTIDSVGRRLVSLVNLTVSTPPATWTFTSTMAGSNTYLTLAALKVATA